MFWRVETQPIQQQMAPLSGLYGRLRELSVLGECTVVPPQHKIGPVRRSTELETPGQTLWMFRYKCKRLHASGISSLQKFRTNF